MIWFWLAFVSLASIYGLIKWFLYFTLKSRKNFIRRFLKANGIEYYSENAAHFNTEMLQTFVDRYCRQDGVLLSVETNLIFFSILLRSFLDYVLLLRI